MPSSDARKVKRMVARALASSSFPSAMSGSHVPLPRELRDEIYDILFQDSIFTFTERRFQHWNRTAFVLAYGSVHVGNFPVARGRGQKFPLWLLTSKKTLAEGLEQFYRRARCVEYNFCCHRCFGVSGKCKTFPGQLLTFDRIQNIDYQIWQSRPSSPYDQTMGRSWNLADQQKPNVIRLVPEAMNGRPHGLGDLALQYLIANPSHYLKQIKFSVKIPIEPLEDLRWPVEKYEWMVDLSYLENLGRRFNRVTFRMACPTIRQRERHPYVAIEVQLKMYAIVYPKFQQELARVGKILVGTEVGRNGATEEEAGGWCMRDYLAPMLKEDDLIQDSRPRDGRFEWYLEVSRHTSKRTGHIQYEGMHHCQKEHTRHGRDQFLDCFRLMDSLEDGKMSWICDTGDKTGEILSVDIPLQ